MRVLLLLYVNKVEEASLDIDLRSYKSKIDEWKKIYALHLKDYEIYLQVPSKFNDPKWKVNGKKTPARRLP